MRCSGFRDKHVAFVDGGLSHVDQLAMQEHLATCPRCAAHDTSVRRAILLFRNVPQIQPSAQFSTRLRARLRDTPHGTEPPHELMPAVRIGMLVSTALGVMAAGYIAMIAVRRVGADADKTFHAIPIATALPVAASAIEQLQPMPAGLHVVELNGVAPFGPPLDTSPGLMPVRPRGAKWSIGLFHGANPVPVGGSPFVAVSLTR